MKRRTVHMPKLTKDKATGIAVVDEFAFTMWPHAFNIWAARYKVPDHFLIALLYLWDATVGTGDASGDLSIGQVPVRERTVRKWLAAFCAAGFFEEHKLPSGSRRGSFFVYQEKTSPEAWEQLFKVAGLVQAFGDWDKVSPERFAGLVARAAGADVPFSQAQLEFRREMQAAIADGDK